MTKRELALLYLSQVIILNSKYEIASNSDDRSDILDEIKINIEKILNLIGEENDRNTGI